MGTTDRRERHRSSLRREILDAASRLFAEEGYQRVTMRRVAERIDYPPTTIYLYYRDKRELFGAICDDTFSQLASKLERLKATPDTPLGRLREGLRTYLEFGTSHPNHYVVTFLQMQEPGRFGITELVNHSTRLQQPAVIDQEGNVPPGIRRLRLLPRKSHPVTLRSTA